MAERGSFEDPHKGNPVELRTVPVKELEVVEHQRKARPAHVKNLVASIERIGFIVPLVAVARTKDGSEVLVVIDGQHRLQAALELGLEELPVFVVPEHLAQRMMNLNVEKDLNIREKAAVSLGVYRAFIDSTPEMPENDPEVIDSIEVAYYVTLGLAYEGPGRLAGSAFEPLLKKADFFLEDRSISAALEVREGRAAKFLEANRLVKEVIEQAKEMGIFHQYFQYQLMSHIDPYKRKRGPLAFDDVFDKAIAKLTKLNDEPDGLHKISGGG